MMSDELFLLDVNVLIARIYEDHLHHSSIKRWFDSGAQKTWATCGFTQSAFLRICSQRAFQSDPLSIGQLRELLSHNTRHLSHRYLPINVMADDVFEVCSGGLVGHRQVTDAWLLTIAVKSHAKLVTFDEGLESLLATPSERSRSILTLRN